MPARRPGAPDGAQAAQDPGGGGQARGQDGEPRAEGEGDGNRRPRHEPVLRAAHPRPAHPRAHDLRVPRGDVHALLPPLPGHDGRAKAPAAAPGPLAGRQQEGAHQDLRGDGLRAHAVRAPPQPPACPRPLPPQTDPPFVALASFVPPPPFIAFLLPPQQSASFALASLARPTPLTCANMLLLSPSGTRTRACCRSRGASRP